MAIQPVFSPFVEVLFWEGATFHKLAVGDYLIGPSFGHVAINTHIDSDPKNDKYISFWPGRCGQEKSRHCTKTTAHFHLYDTDCKIEGKPPKDPIRLDTLDIAAINACFDKFQRGNYSWKIFGSSNFSKPYERNCAGLSLYLLEAGKIRALVSSNILKDQKTTLMILSISALIFGGLCYGVYQTFRPLFNAKELCSTCCDNYRAVSNFDIQMRRDLSKLSEWSDHQMQNNPATEDLAGLFQGIRLAVKMSDLEIERDHSLTIGALKSLVGSIQMQSIVGVCLTTIGLVGYFTFTGNKTLMQTITPADVIHLAGDARKRELSMQQKTVSSRSYPSLWRAAIGVAGFAVCFFSYFRNYLK